MNSGERFAGSGSVRRIHLLEIDTLSQLRIPGQAIRTGAWHRDWPFDLHASSRMRRSFAIPASLCMVSTAALREPIEGPRTGPVVISCASTEKALRES